MSSFRLAATLEVHRDRLGPHMVNVWKCDGCGETRTMPAHWDKRMDRKPEAPCTCTTTNPHLIR